MLSNIPCVYVPQLLYSSVDGCLGCFPVLATVNSAAMNNGIYVSLSILVSSGICLGVRLLGHMVEKEMATHSSVLAWKIPWMEGPGGLQSMGLQRVGHD